MSDPVLQFEDVSVVRDGREILRDVSWRVNPGEHWALLGANGSGKTSLLNLLLGYLTPTRGRIELACRDTSPADLPVTDQQWDAWRRNIGFVSSSISRLVEPQETAREIVLAGRYAMVNFWSWRETPPADLADADRVLGEIECADLADQPWLFLSQGERQRVLIGRALMAPSLKLLVLDEPCAGLDPVAREHFLGFVERLAGRTGNSDSGPTLILVTHHVEEIVGAVTHALVLKDGRTLASGPIAETVRSEILSEAFSAPVEVDEAGGRFQLTVPPGAEGVV